MKRFFYTVTTIALSLTAFYACTYRDKETLYPQTLNTCDTGSITYANYVGSFITGTCAVAGCHNAASSSGGVNLSNYAGLKAIADNGELMGTINHKSGFSPMPQNQPKLDDCTIARIQAWVNAGALNN